MSETRLQTGISMGSPSCSVIIPTADRNDLLSRSIESVLRQTRTPAEIIIVDNGEKDAMIPPHLRDRVILIRTEPRIGPGRSRNIGAYYSTADYVGFLDDDDIWEPSYIEQSMRLIEKEDADVVVGALKRKGLDGLVKPYKLFPSDLAGQRSIYFKNPGFGGQNFIIRKDFFLKIGCFSEDMPASVDRDLAARILQHKGRILVQAHSVAILCDHTGHRARKNIAKGNWMFITKHWRHMKASELARALRTFAKRWMHSRFDKQHTSLSQ